MPGPALPKATRDAGPPPLEPPAAIAFLFNKGVLLEERREEAMSHWQSARVRASQGDEKASFELVAVTRQMVAHADRNQQDERSRAILESALAVCLPAHRAIVLGALVRGAAHEGDVDSAEQWSRHFEGDYDDLESETEWRVALAMVATLTEDYAGALRVLGLNGGEIRPALRKRFTENARLRELGLNEREIAIHPNLEGLATGLRASCLTHLGMKLDALFLVQVELERVASIRGALQRMAQRYPHLRLGPLLDHSSAHRGGKKSWLLLPAILLGALAMGGLFAYLTWVGHGARSFVEAEFAAVRKDSARYVSATADPEMREAYLAIADSTSDSVSLFTSTKGRGDFSHFVTDHCISADLSNAKGSRSVEIVVREENDKYTITAMSTTRHCSCGKAHESGTCRLR